MEKFRITVTRNAIVKILTVVAIFVLVKKSTDIYLYIFIMAAGYLVSQMIMWLFVKKYITFVIPSVSNIIKHIKPNVTLFLPVIATSIYKIMDKIMLGSMTNMSQVGYYENAEKKLLMFLLH